MHFFTSIEMWNIGLFFSLSEKNMQERTDIIFSEVVKQIFTTSPPGWGFWQNFKTSFSAMPPNTKMSVD